MFISKHKNRYYYLYFFDESGKRRSTTTGTQIKREALRFLSNFTPPSEQTTTKVKPILWSELHKIIIQDLRLNNFSPGTIYLYDLAFRRFAGLIGNKVLQLITPLDLEAYKQSRAGDVKPDTLNIELRVLRAIFNKSKNFIDTNPAKDLKQVRIEQKKIKAFTGAEIELIRERLNSDVLQFFFEIGINAGLRLGEIINLKFANVNFFDKVIEVSNSDTFKTKSRKNRVVPVSQRLHQVLRPLFIDESGALKLNNPDAYLFSPNKIRAFDKRYISRRFGGVLRLLNLDGYCFHCTRHTFVTRLVNAGVDINKVMRLAGHSSVTTTTKYMHCRFNELQFAVNQI